MRSFAFTASAFSKVLNPAQRCSPIDLPLRYAHYPLFDVRARLYRPLFRTHCYGIYQNSSVPINDPLIDFRCARIYSLPCGQQQTICRIHQASCSMGAARCMIGFLYNFVFIDLSPEADDFTRLRVPTATGFTETPHPVFVLSD